MSRGDGNFLKARQEAKKGELDEQLREYINEWRKQRSKEEEELQRQSVKRNYLEPFPICIWEGWFCGYFSCNLQVLLNLLNSGWALQVP